MASPVWIGHEYAYEYCADYMIECFSLINILGNKEQVSKAKEIKEELDKIKKRIEEAEEIGHLDNKWFDLFETMYDTAKELVRN